MDLSPRRAKQMLTWCAVCLGSYVGTLARYGFTYFRGAASPPSNLLGVLLANVLGSFILGILSHWQASLGAKSAPRLHRISYAGAASGLCGSLTTFSALNAEAGKLFLNQIQSLFPGYGVKAS